MRIYRLKCRRFRGFERAVILPARHVLLMGEPGAGRSDVIEGLRRVLTPESLRFHLPDEMDFYQQDTQSRAEVEVVLGDLTDAEAQLFFNHLEIWDLAKKRLINELPRPQLLDDEKLKWVVRLCYRIRWNTQYQRAEHWVDYPSTSVPDDESFDRVGSIERENLPFATPALDGRVLDLATGGSFRRLIETTSDGFADARQELVEQLQALAVAFAAKSPIRDALKKIAEPLRGMPRAGKKLEEMVRFLPEGGSVAGVLRSLGPAIEFPDGAGSLPLARHGSTLSGLLEVAQALAHLSPNGGILALDDFGEDMDVASAQHIASNLRRNVSQLWLSTRRAAVAEVFRPEELIRLTRPSEGKRTVHARTRPTTKVERSIARQVTVQLLPHLTSRAVIVFEGPSDWAAISSLAARLQEEEGVALPSLYAVGLVDAGGVTEVPKLCEEARKLGLRVVAVIDGDPKKNGPDRIEKVKNAADTVIRLPEGHAIERALIHALKEEILRETLCELKKGLNLEGVQNFAELRGKGLTDAAEKFLKSSGSFHAQFVEFLPENVYPVVAREILEKAIEAATADKGCPFVQLTA